MNQFIFVETMQALDEPAIRARFPNTMFPTPIEAHHVDELGIVPLVEDELPALQPGEMLSEGDVRLEAGRAVRGWVVNPPSADFWPGQIASRRYDVEVAGIEVGGLHVTTDDRSKTLIAGAAIEAMLDSDYVLRWKSQSGFIDLSASQVIAVASAVRAHVQGCFDREDELLGTLAAGTFEPSMLEEGWPVTA
ncbi:MULTISPECIES: DUF4376 domain-containing protein [unclassified Pseudomonas]|uniref:DUF4376 domain-containing protein n=1 Tax=unclassified Pseudomonas TaxID=196821 RepID=UPI00244AEAE6|nr:MULTISPECIES: DUF4376 domain-containing protein [unclassified Pseudomonas]MDH0896361.1 DUF4376 domain-containing protein [Pseudomonas sp. GD03875]MDH1066121.1 DUF4376 domain-containing protein [Pseudomonas sp. GD03985]